VLSLNVPIERLGRNSRLFNDIAELFGADENQIDLVENSLGIDGRYSPIAANNRRTIGHHKHAGSGNRYSYSDMNPVSNVDVLGDRPLPTDLKFNIRKRLESAVNIVQMGNSQLRPIGELIASSFLRPSATLGFVDIGTAIMTAVLILSRILLVAAAVVMFCTVLLAFWEWYITIVPLPPGVTVPLLKCVVSCVFSMSVCSFALFITYGLKFPVPVLAGIKCGVPAAVALPPLILLQAFNAPYCFCCCKTGITLIGMIALFIQKFISFFKNLSTNL